MFVGYLGCVEASHEETAVEVAAKEFNIAEALRDRLVTRRDNVRSRGKRTRNTRGKYFG